MGKIKRVKVQVTLNEELVEKIDKYANMIGTSRSALCGLMIGQGIMGYDKSLDVIDKYVVNELGDTKADE